MGILDSLFGGQQSQDPNQLQGPGYAEKLSAMLAPGLHQALQQAREQQMTKAALSQMGGNPLPPGMAPALASNPELMRQAGGAYLPSPGKVEQVPTPGGGAVFMQSGQAPGGGAYVKPLNIGAAPSAPAPTAAALTSQGVNPTPPGVLPGQQPTPGTPGDTAHQLPPPPPTKPGVIAGTAGDMQDKILWGKQNGYKPDDLLQFVPDAWRGEIKSLWDGTQSVKDLSTRGAISEGNRSTFLNLAHQMNPSWDENRSEALNTYRKGYMATGTQGTVGFQRQSYDTTLNHLNTVLDSAADMHNSDSIVGPAANLGNRIRGMGGAQGALQDTFDAKTDMLAGETDKFISGKAATEGGTKQYKEKWSRNQTPRQTAAAAEAYLNMVQGKKEALEKERNENFGSAEAASAFPIGTNDEPKIAQIKAKIAALEATGTAQAGTLRTPQEAAAAAAPPAAPTTNTLPPGWSVK